MGITWDKTYDDMNHVDWSPNGSPLFPENVWGGVSLDGDSSNNSVSQDGILKPADGKKHTLGFFYTSVADVATQMLISQGDLGVGGNRYLIYGTATGITVFFTDSTGGNQLRVTYTGGASDGNKHHYIVAIDGDNDLLKLYQDKVPVGTFIKYGTGYGGMLTDSYDTIVGAHTGAGNFIKTGTFIDRVKFAKTYYATQSDVDDEFDAEFALLSGSPTQQIVSPMATQMSTTIVNNITAS